MNISPSDLSSFHCTENYFKTMLQKLWYSDGVQFFFANAGDCGAYWMLGEFIEIACHTKCKQEDFLVVEIHSANDKATIKAQDGNDNYLFEKNIDYTDLADGCWKFYIEGTYCGDTEGKLIYLPSER